MASGAGNDDLKAAAAERLRDDVAVPGTVESNEECELRCGSISGGIRAGRETLAVEVADASQIAFALLSDIGNEE